jgi:hypothetical protein
MKANLKINKEIIEDFYRNTKINDSNSYIIKLKEEINLLTSMNDKFKDEVDSLRIKVGYYEQITNDTLLNYRDSTESLKNKLFILENVIIKKDNLILCLNSKLNKVLEREIFNDSVNIEKETIVKLLI